MRTSPHHQLREMRQARPALQLPEGFHEFWSTLRDDIEALVPAPTCQELTRTNAGPSLISVRFQSVDGCEIRAFMARWNDAVRRPLIVAAHGYGGQVDSDRIQRLALRGAHAIAMDARGFGRSAAGVSLSEHGYLLTGYENPRRSILRGAVADYLVSHRVAIELVGEVGKTTFSGFSFAGGLATMAQAVSGAAHLLAVGVPTFGWTERRIELCRSGSGFELARFMDRHPTERDRAMNTMRYFDIVHHAPQINARSIVGIGLRDDIVPAETVYAMVNHLGLPPTLLEYPCSHSSEPEERLWNDFEDYWVGQASSSS